MADLLGLRWVRLLQQHPAALEDWTKWLAELRGYNESGLNDAARATEIVPRKLYYLQGKIDLVNDIEAFVEVAKLQREELSENGGG